MPGSKDAAAAGVAAGEAADAAAGAEAEAAAGAAAAALAAAAFGLTTLTAVSGNPNPGRLRFCSLFSPNLVFCTLAAGTLGSLCSCVAPAQSTGQEAYAFRNGVAIAVRRQRLT